MAIALRSTLDPAAAAAAWASRVGASGSRWIKGIENPRRLPNADPAGNAAKWADGVAAAQGKFTAKITGQAYLTKLDAGATAKQANYSSAGTRAQPNMQAALTKVLPAIQTIVQSLPPRGPRGSNDARATGMSQGLHAKKGTLGA